MKIDERSPDTADLQGSMESVPLHSFYRALGSDGRLQYWQLDAERRGGVADDYPQPGTTQRGPCPGGDDSAHVSVQPPAGALADIVDRRRLLIAVQIGAVAIAALFALYVWLGWSTPNWLLTFISLTGIATVLAMPAWQSIVPQLVRKEELRSAVALNGVGLNISRAIGPALAGLAIGALAGCGKSRSVVLPPQFVAFCPFVSR